MLRLTAAALLLTATAAQADTIGADFCQAMQDNYLACGEEAKATNSNGQFKMECPDTIRTMVTTYEAAKQKAAPSQRPELDRANELWRNIAYRIGWRVGETEDQFTKRRDRQIDDIVAQCEKLYGLDSN